MGSLVNRIDNQVEDLSSNVVNLNDHVGKIKDADFARESTALATSQIQQQAAMSILAQGNSRVTRVLEILGK
jgi:flagellin